jgi:hypothetical protein
MASGRDIAGTIPVAGHVAPPFFVDFPQQAEGALLPLAAFEPKIAKRASLDAGVPITTMPGQGFIS